MRLLLLLTSFVFACISLAQHPYYVALNDENGLPSNEVYQVLQDKNNFLWIACEEGLFRYDGFRFKKYKSSNPNGIAVSDLRLDNQNRIWCRNFSGQIYCVDNERLKTVVDAENGLSSNNNFDIDAEGNLWCVLKKSLCCITNNGEKNLMIPLVNHTKSPHIVSICCTENGVYFSDLTGELYCYSFQKKAIQNLRLPAKKASNYTIQLFKSEGKLYASFIDTKNTKTTVYSLINNVFHSIFSFNQEPKDRINQMVTIQGDWYFSTANGLAFPKRNIRSTKDLHFAFEGKKVSSIYQDREGAHWISTLQDGVYYVPNPAIQVKDDFYLDKQLTAIAFTQNGELALGTFTGAIHLLNLKNGTTHFFSACEGGRSVKKIINTSFGLFAARGSFSHITPQKTIEFPLYNCRDFSINHSDIYYITPQIAGKSNFSQLTNKQNPYGINNEEGGRCVVFNPADQCLYYGYNNALIVKMNNRQKRVTFHHKNIIAYQLKQANNVVYAATINQGLLVLRAGKVIASFNKNNGFENEIKLVCASSNNIWFCSSNYLYKCNLKSKKRYRFAKWYGINAKSINDLMVYNDTIYLACDKGLIYFPEKLTGINTNQTFFEIQKITIGPRKMAFKTSIQLPFNHDELTFHIACVSLKGHGYSKIRYRLLGLSNTWKVVPASTRKIAFEKLPSGTFKLEIQSINESLIVGKRITFNVLVDTPYWEKWWFYVLISVSSMTAIGLVFLWQLRVVQQRSELNSKVLKAQLTALKAQMNPHFMYNALNSIQALILQQDAKNASIYLSKFSKLMRMILEDSGKSEISLREEMDMLTLYLELEKLRFGNDFSYRIHLENNLDEYSVFLPPVLLQPFVENALKHGLLHRKGSKELIIHFELKTSELVASITDNGIGRVHANEIKSRRTNESTSFASNAIEQQVELLNTFHGHAITLQIEDLYEGNEASGTKVIITIPQSSFGK